MDENEANNSSIIADQYELVCRIVSNLPEVDLQSCEQVNKMWSDAVKKERNAKRRKKVASLFWKGESQITTYYLKSPAFDSPNHRWLYEKLREWRHTTMIKGHASLTISVGEPLGGPGTAQNFLADPYKVDQLLGTNNVAICSSGVVVGEPSEAPLEIENTSGKNETPVLGSIVFPDLPNVDIISFDYSEMRISEQVRNLRARTKDSEDELAFDKAVIAEVLGSDQLRGRECDIKCAIFMSNVLEISRTSILIQSLGKVTRRKIAIGGCIGNLAHNSKETDFATLDDHLEAMETYSEDQPNKYARTTGLIFAGKGVEAASILLNTQIRTKSKVEAELKRLQACGLDTSNSCAFMFACCGRGKSFYKGKANIESQAFRDLFPITPLLGIFGNGEIGVTHLPSKSDRTQDTFSDPSASKRLKMMEDKRLLPDEFSHSFTSVFVLLSFK